MSRPVRDRSGFSPLGKALTGVWAVLRKLFRRQNFRILWKAIREEPPDLILSNFLQLLDPNRGRFGSPRKFIGFDEDIKVYLLDGRIEAGILKVVVWVLARKGLKNSALACGLDELPAATDRFSKPELHGLFAEFTGFEQIGLLFQLPFNGNFGGLQLNLVDHSGYRISVPVGPAFQYVPEEQETDQVQLPGTLKNFLVVLHDWSRPFTGDTVIFKAALDQMLPEDIPAMVCFEQPLEQWTDEDIAYIPHARLNEILDSTPFEHLLLMSWDCQFSKADLLKIAAYVTEHPQIGLLYFDEDSYGPKGQYHSPVLKPAFSPEYLASDNYIGANFCLGRSVGETVDWFSTLDFRCGAYHFLLRAMEAETVFSRMPEVRLHGPQHDLVYYTRREAAQIQVRTTHFVGRGIRLNPGLIPGSSEVIRPMPDQPLISIIIPFRDQWELLAQCVQSIMDKTLYPNFEVLLVNNNSREAATRQFLEQLTANDLHFRHIPWDEPFNYARLNNWAAERTKGDLLLLLNNDIEVITKGWLTRMTSYLAEGQVGAVGPKLLYPDRTVQHAGIITGIGGIAAHPHKHYPDHFGGYQGRANKVQNLSACTAACLLIRRSLFESLSGFDEEHLPIAFNDVDLCLRIHQAGFRIVYTPFVKLYHHESVSRGSEDTPAKRKRAKKEIHYFRRKWRDWLAVGDPYYHPEFLQRRADFEVFR